MFHLHSLKEPSPKGMCETINFTSEVEATISSQESQPPPIQRQNDQSTANEAVEISITEQFQPADFNFSKRFSEFPSSKKKAQKMLKQNRWISGLFIVIKG